MDTTKVKLELTKTQCHMLTQILRRDSNIQLRNYIYKEMHKDKQNEQ